MKGPFLLPASVMEGDYLEIGMVGAYGRVMATRFNGFGEYDQVIVDDAPQTTMYGDESVDETRDSETAAASSVRAIDAGIRGKSQKV